MGEAVCERPNRLSKSRSRYLRMHACDPVGWHPWGEEAFRKALEEDKPLFLSIGYSSCHWCHVMQRESFQDEEVASVLNSFFVPVKVDREEMPDVDEIYMTAAIAVTGSGGWPLSVFLTPDLRPFYAGTYFPRDRFLEILGSIRDLWSRDRERILRAAQEIHRAVSDYLSPRAGGSPSASSFERVFEKAFTEISASFDPVFGGFGASMKFPMVPHHQFLLRYWYRRGDEAALRMVLRSVSSMARLGLHDHLLGGFFRYTVDRGWRIPHFEKMLYDNAQILGLLVDLYKATGAPEHLVLARKTSDFLVREMAGPEGLFYSSLDAEAGGVEGAPYLWSEAELEEALGKDLAEVAKKIYGWSPSTLVGGRMHPVRAASPRDLARSLGISFEEAARLYEEAEARLVGYRLSKKPRPGADDKYLADWNSLAARAFARLYTVSGDLGHLAAARRIVGFLWERMWLGDRMAHVFSGGEASSWGYLSDTASFGLASLEIYTASFEEAFADLALEAIRSVEGVFARRGVLSDNPGAPGSRSLEISSPSDEPVPSGASMAVELLSLAYLFTGDPRYRDGALKIYSQASAYIEHAPQQLVHMLTSLDTVERPSYQVVVTGDPGGGDVGSFLRTVWRRYWPGILSVSPKPPRAALLESLYRGKAWAGDPVYHICYGTACAMPARGAEEALKRFEELRRGFLGARG